MAFPQSLVLPPVPERLLFSPADAYMGMSGIYPRIGSMGRYYCNHRDEHVAHPLTCQCRLLTPQQLLIPLVGCHHLSEGFLMRVFPLLNLDLDLDWDSTATSCTSPPNAVVQSHLCNYFSKRTGCP